MTVAQASAARPKHRHGVPILVSRNGVTAMGHDLAQRLGMTLFGRASRGRFICYTGAHRFDAVAVPQDAEV